MTWTRRRCPNCAQMMVVEAELGADCPACGSHVGVDAVEAPPQPEPEPEQEPELNPEPEADPPPASEWNLGEPMHRVFWLCLVAPSQVAMATVFRSLQWVLLFAWMGQLMVQVCGLIIAPKLLEAGAEELQMIEDLAAATERAEAGGPERRRVMLAAKKLCSMSMLSPELRLHCAFEDSFDTLKPAGQFAKQRSAAWKQMRQPIGVEGWIWLGPQALLMLLVTVAPLWGLLGLARHPQAWSLALKAVAFSTPPMVVGFVVGAALMSIGGELPATIGLMAIMSGAVWALPAMMGHLVRLGGLAAPQAALLVGALMMFTMVMLSSLGMMV